MYKGDDGDSLYGNNSNEPSSSMVSDSNPVKFINTSPEVHLASHNDFYLFITIINPFLDMFRLSSKVKKMVCLCMTY